MPYLIDGHNLIPKLGSLSLNELDDEIRLIEMLQEYCHRKNRNVEVFFDKAQPGHPRAKVYGNVTARFIREGKTADQAIQSRLIQLGKTARNWIVVSSDRQVQTSAKAARAQALPSESFAAELKIVLSGEKAKVESRQDELLSEEEIDEWLDLFQGKRKP